MSDKAASEIKITAEELSAYLGKATDLLTSISYQPARDLADARSARAPGEKPSGFSLSSVTTPPKMKTMAIIQLASTLNRGDKLMDETINHALNTVRMGLQLGLHVSSLFGKYSGLERLKEKQASNLLVGDTEKAQWSAGMEAQAAITLFVASYYVSWKLNGYKSEELSSVNVNFYGLPEPLALRGQIQAVSGALYHWGSYLETAQTSLDFLKLTQLYFKAVYEDLKAQSPAFVPNATAFTDVSYRLEHTEFTLNGFHGELNGGQSKVEFKPLRLEQVVGNHEAKRATLRLSQFIIAYDMERKMNPFMEFNALPWIYLFKGQPGTGKTLLIRALITLVNEYCGTLELPFLVHPLSNTVISTYQGGSAENLENWYSVLRNPSLIIVAPVDDAENVFQERSGENVSAGTKEAVATFLRNTEGATAINRGNVLMPWATNIPDKIDAAAMSRIMGRVDVPGAKTPEDFMDQLGMWGREANGWRKGKEIIDLSWPNDYTYLSSQGITPPEEMSTDLDHAVAIQDKRLSEILERLRASNYTLRQYKLYGAFFAEIHELFPRFTSREVRNITTNVMLRLFSFDFDSSWLTSRDAFVAKDYDTKKEMILDAALQNMGGLKVSEVFYQETVRYLNTMVDIIDGGRQRRIKELAERIREDQDARSLAASG